MKVLMAMSGGVDSTVAAMLLKKQGYDVVGCTFRTFDNGNAKNTKSCCSEDSIIEATKMAQNMGIEHHVVDFRKIFRERVVGNFIDEYLSGRTPNPCVLCNSYIKWGELMRTADELGCEQVASGHYARICESNGHLYLRKAVDTIKDQTYFMWMLTEENLRRILFPLGEMTKTEVRQMAKEHGYEQLSKKSESQDICFVPGGDYRTFLNENASDTDKTERAFTSGKYINAEGKVIGTHCGFANYTIGQRKGLGIALGEPAFVTNIDACKNEVTLGRHDDLYKKEVNIQGVFFRGDLTRKVQARIRYRGEAQNAVYDGNTLHFDEPVWGVTPGQSAVMYQDEMLVGGGFIS